MLFFQDSKTPQVISIASRIDWSLFLTIFVLAAIGLVVQFSTSGQDTAQIWQHASRIAIGVVLMIAIAGIPISQLEKYTPHVYALGLILLILVAFFGTGRGGAQRWLDLKIISIQPSELMKLMVPMMVAWVLTRPQSPRSNEALRIIIAGALVFVPAGLVYFQPDLGTALLILGVGVYAIYLGGIPWRWLGSAAVIGLLAIPLIWPFLHEYQRLRVTTLFDPWQDPMGVGYHSIQSMIAIGSGGTIGKGWLNGSQSQLEFIPERSTDFVFSVFAEEFGLLGVFILMLLFLYLIVRCISIAFQLNSSYARIVVGSVAIMIFIHVFVNIGMVSGILPVVGIPLPMISYGGTSIVTILVGIGIVMGVRNEKD